MGFMLDKFAKLKQEANLKGFLDKESINEKGRELRKLENKKVKTEEEEKKIRQIQQETKRLENSIQQAQQLVNRASLGEQIIKYYFAYKMTSLLCRALSGYDRASYYNGGALLGKAMDEVQEQLELGEIDLHAARADQIEQVYEQFVQISEEAKTLGISQEDVFTQQDRASLIDLAAISRDQDNPQQAELYAAKCEEFGLNREEAFQAFQQDIESTRQEIKANKEQAKSYEIEV